MIAGLFPIGFTLNVPNVSLIKSAVPVVVAAVAGKVNQFILWSVTFAPVQPENVFVPNNAVVELQASLLYGCKEFSRRPPCAANVNTGIVLKVEVDERRIKEVF